MLAYDYPVMGAFLTMLWFFLWVMWLFLLFRTISDVLRSTDLSGATKVGWMLGVILFPYLGVFAYVILRGEGMAGREAERRERIEEAFRAHLREARGVPTEELTRLGELRERGVIDEDEFRQQKARLLA
jgi:hypothetical protein